MGKILFWAVVLATGWGVWSFMRLSQRRREQTGAHRSGSEPERIVACTHCGVHLPASEALPGAGDTWYCCAEHRNAGRR